MYFTVKVFLFDFHVDIVPRSQASCGSHRMVYWVAQSVRAGGYDRVHGFRLRLVHCLCLLIVAEMILAAVSLATDFSYAPTNDHVVAVFIGVILFHGLLNTLNTAWLARITSVSTQGVYIDNSITPFSTSVRRWQLLSHFLSCKSRRMMLKRLSLKWLTALDGQVTASHFFLASSACLGS